MRILLGAIASFAFVGAAEAACPDFSLDPGFSETTLQGGFTPDPFAVDIPSGGEVDLSTCAEVPGSGWVAAAPDYRITYEATGATLTFTIVPEDDTDTVLVINGPSGEWYFDDDSGFAFNPELSFPNAPAGVYDIWVGNFSQGDSKATKLWVTERD